MKKVLSFGLVTVTLLLACTTKPSSFSSLRDQGILPLSSKNPYLGSNLFLAHEAERSSYLFNFLEGRGAPKAISLESNGRLILYYPDEKELYVADMDSGSRSPQWVVKGPFGIQRKDYRNLARMESSPLEDPVFVVHGKTYRFSFDRVEEHPRILVPSITVLPRPTARPVAKRRPKAVIVAKGGETQSSSAPFKPLNLDQQAIAMSQGFAERSVSGDLIHTVKGETEPLTDVVKWYTGGVTAEEEIATANGLSKGASVPKGTRLTIPLKHVKNFKEKKL